jgi:hypothetical protein
MICTVVRAVPKSGYSAPETGESFSRSAELPRHVAVLYQKLVSHLYGLQNCPTFGRAAPTRN